MQSVLSKNRIAVNELLSELRSQGVGNINQVEYAAIEQNGSLSLIKKGGSNLAHTVIIDGQIMKRTLINLGYNEIWLNKRLSERKAMPEEILLFTVDDQGEVDIIMKDGSF